MTSDQYTELVAFIAQKFEEQWRRTLVLLEQAREERRILGEGVDARFGRVDERLDGIDGRLDKVDGRLDKVDGRLDKVDGRLDKMDGRLDKMDGRLDKMDGRLDKMHRRLDRMDEGFGGRLRSLEEWVRRVGSDHEARIRALE